LVAGGNLMVEGDLGGSFYILLEGSVVVVRNDAVLSTLSQGVSIGEIVYLQPEHNIRTATVRAQSNIIVMKIRGESLRKASSEVQGCFDKAFIKMLVDRLVAANQQLAEWDSN
jgi:CRP-like cAMP-binding protein